MGLHQPAGGPGGWNIWRSRRTATGWSRPQAVAFNSEQNDFDPTFSPDGREVYFFSNRPGGLGKDDLWRVAVKGDGFGPPEHLGPEVNSAGAEFAPILSPDGSTLLFASDGRGGAGRHDLFLARRRGSGFAPARPVPGTLNTPADEFDATFLADGRTIVFARAANFETDQINLYAATRQKGVWGLGTRLPLSVNTADADTLGPVIDWSRKGQLTFSGRRPEAGAGKTDLYVIRYASKGGPG